MAGESLSQAEADALLALPKRFVEPRTILLAPGSNDTHPLESKTSSDTFLLDLWRGSLRLTKVRYQTRTRMAIVLARLDVDAAPHTNPDGERIGGTHLHVYLEGYDTRWAFPLDPDEFPDPQDLQHSLEDFCRYCSIDRPTIQPTLP